MLLSKDRHFTQHASAHHGNRPGPRPKKSSSRAGRERRKLAQPVRRHFSHTVGGKKSSRDRWYETFSFAFLSFKKKKKKKKANG
ncbi:MAG: hypothetical protein ACRC4N_10190, partial [Gammaproteobacteria bacterium]